MKFTAVAMLVLSVMSVSAQEFIPLYPAGKMPNSRAADITEKTEQTKDGLTIISNVTTPGMSVFLPKSGKGNGTAIIIYPGGGYAVEASGHEGTEVARLFAEMGITAFVVKYRLPDPRIMMTQELGPLQDALRAIQIVRQRASEWKLSVDKIGIIGFSAGGHLASTAGTLFQKVVISNPEKISLRPDFMILMYPVISSDTAISHKGSFKNLLGDHMNAQTLHDFSSEFNVTDNTPPTFLVHASDDRGVKPENSIVFYEALIKHHVPAEMHIYQGGGHGFGLHNKTTSDLWTDRLASWLRANHWL